MLSPIFSEDFYTILPLEFSDTIMYNVIKNKVVDLMPIRYKIDVLAALKEKGYSQNRIRNEKLIGQSYLTQLRHGELVSWKTIETVCKLLECQPGDILEYAPDED